MASVKYFDNRWNGNFGIGRYSRELLTRLNPEWTASELSGNPAQPLKAIQSTSLKYGARDLLYSPGFAGVITPARQILTIHDLIHLNGPDASVITRSYYNHFLKPLLLKSEIVLTVSSVSAEYIEQWVKNPRISIEIVPNGVSQAFVPRPGAEKPQDHPSLLYVGNDKPHKNVEVLFKALAMTPDAKLTVVSSQNAGFLSLAEKYEISSRVTVLSNLSEEQLAEHYRQSHATLMPSLLEGYGMPALESIASGTPVLYWKGCHSVRGIVGEKGLAVDAAADANQWAEAIRTLTNNPRQYDDQLASFQAPTWEDSATHLNEVLSKY